MSIPQVYKFKTRKVWDQIMGCCRCKEFLCLQHGKSGEVREKKQSLRVVTDMVCHMYGIRRGVTTDKFSQVVN